MPDRPKKPPVPTEAAVQAGVLGVLKFRGVLAWRSNSRVFSVPGKGGRPRPMRAGLGNGSADVIGVLPGSGRFFAVECKRPGERPTPAQVAWLAAVNRAGGLAVWVDDLATLDRYLGWERRYGPDMRVEFDDHGGVMLVLAGDGPREIANPKGDEG